MLTGVTVWLSLGSNVAGRENRVRSAASALGQWIEDMRVSSVYVTPPLSGHGEDYANAVATGVWHGTAIELERLCKSLESDFGRRRGEGCTDVEIDVDLVMFGDEVCRPADFNREYFLRGYNELNG